MLKAITKQLKIAHKNTWTGLTNARLLLRRYMALKNFRKNNMAGRVI